MGQSDSKPGQSESKQQGKIGDVVLTDSDKKAIREAWQAFCKSHPEPGPVLFSALLDKYPKYGGMFHDFRDVPKDALTQVPMFKTHSTAMGKYLNDVVELLDSPLLLADVVRTNALEHTTRNGVLPLHFESLWRLIVARLTAEAQVPRAAASSWEKLLKALQALTVEVYESMGITSTQEEAVPTSSVSVQGTTPGKQPNIKEEAATSKPEASNLATKSSSEPKVTKTKGSNPESKTTGQTQPKPKAREAQGSEMETAAAEEKSASDSKGSKSKSGLPKKQERQ